MGGQIIADLGIKSMRLMTNNPSKVAAMLEFGLMIGERVPLITAPSAEDVRYLIAKQETMGHLLGFPGHALARAVHGTN
jgi:3,4-dihydroxy 2-butanone 4-phosphate synthase / GTP cyclohydrolase II